MVFLWCDTEEGEVVVVVVGVTDGNMLTEKYASVITKEEIAVR